MPEDPGGASHSSQNVAIFTGDRVLFQNNRLSWSDGEGGLSIKEAYSDDVIVVGNLFIHPGASGGVSVSTTARENTDIYLYGNAVFSGVDGFRTYKDYDRIFYWANIVSGVRSKGLWVGGRSSGDCVGLTRWYNNTVANAGDGTVPRYDGDSNLVGMRVNLVADTGCTPDCEIENNIFWNNDRNGELDQLYLYNNIDSYLHALNFNTYYVSGGTAHFYSSGSGRWDFL